MENSSPAQQDHTPDTEWNEPDLQVHAASFHVGEVLGQVQLSYDDGCPRELPRPMGMSFLGLRVTYTDTFFKIHWVDT